MKPLLFLLITWNKKAQLAIKLVAVRNGQLASTKLLEDAGSRCLWKNYPAVLASSHGTNAAAHLTVAMFKLL